MVYRRRAVMLTNRALISREDAKRAAKEDKPDDTAVKKRSSLPKRKKRPVEGVDETVVDETANEKPKKKARKTVRKTVGEVVDVV